MGSKGENNWRNEEKFRDHATGEKGNIVLLCTGQCSAEKEPVLFNLYFFLKFI